MADILVVDDEKLMRFFVSEILSKSGHSLRQAVNGVEAVELIESRKPDILIT